MTTEIAEYSATEAALTDLASRFKGMVYEVDTPKGLAEADRLAKIEADRLAEEQRKQDELLDADQMLATFRDRFGHLPRYASVVAAIDQTLIEQRKAA